MKDSKFERSDSNGNRIAIAPTLSRIAPTENIRGQLSYLGSNFDGPDEDGRRILRGAVHDPTAFRMNGVADTLDFFRLRTI